MNKYIKMSMAGGAGAFLLYFVIACGGGNSKNDSSTVDTPIAGNDTGRNDITIDSTQFMDDTLHRLVFVDTGRLELKARLKNTGGGVHFYLSVPRPVNLTATVVPVAEDCNIRINNIIQPGNIADGPFGRELKYQLKKKGDYQLIVGHNLMAEGVMSCDFVLKIKLD